MKEENDNVQSEVGEVSKTYQSVFFKTISNKEKALKEKKWFLIDAAENNGLVLGRLAAFITQLIRGKHKTNYTPGADVGDKVIVINAQQVVLTGNKAKTRLHYKHTGYFGHLRSKTPQNILEGKRPEELLMNAVQKMMRKSGAFRETALGNLRVYATATHPHEAQNPRTILFSKLNKKNSHA
jgi:large subunit ribosomal protein L13